jgi:hypothetical protein
MFEGEKGVSIRMLTRAFFAFFQCLSVRIQVSIHPALAVPRKLRAMAQADVGQPEDCIPTPP